MEFVGEYFQGEKTEAMVFVFIGCLMAGISLYCWFVVRRAFSSGMALAFILIAFIQLFVGVTIYLRSPADQERVENMIVLEPERVMTEEIPRMQRVMGNFITYRYIELALLVVGTMMILLTRNPWLKGFGIGLAIQAGVMLTADYFAERRGDFYLKELQTIASQFYKRS